MTDEAAQSHPHLQIRVSGIINESIVDGPGIRLAVFAQGCVRSCPGCHNPETHALDGGYLVDTAEILSEAKKNPLLSGLTFSGGEPFLQARAFAELARMARRSGYHIVTYTGYTFNEILERCGVSKDAETARSFARFDDCDGFWDLLISTDILVDGPYVESKRTLNVPYRGSSNQRVIDVAATLARMFPKLMGS